jgi:hypothetical protein
MTEIVSAGSALGPVFVGWRRLLALGMVCAAPLLVVAHFVWVSRHPGALTRLDLAAIYLVVAASTVSTLYLLLSMLTVVNRLVRVTEQVRQGQPGNP